MGRRQDQIRVNRIENNRPKSSATKSGKLIQRGVRRAPDELARLFEENLGATLQQLRLARGLNQTELGRRLGVSLQQVQKYESGKDRIAASTAYRAAEILGVEVGALYAGLARASARSCGLSKAQRNPFLVLPLTVGPRAARARETELIDVIRSYQAIANAPDRALVRKLLKRLSAAPQQTRAVAR